MVVPYAHCYLIYIRVTSERKQCVGIAQNNDRLSKTNCVMTYGNLTVHPPTKMRALSAWCVLLVVCFLMAIAPAHGVLIPVGKKK
ncbi:hypothetical protein GCK32_007606 [Trichostrongylus colubriformis]|uniref:Uncharacterized protein n=1 Tax=Trichostrongylus colubriformis TaxID=6319 RepID=A0AAN8EX02_TRICO